MTVTVDPAIQQRYDQNAAARRAEAAEVTGELKARQDQIAEQIKKHEDNLAALGRRLAESTVDQPPPVPARRPKNEDISAEASAYQEADDEPEPPAPPPSRPVARAAVEDEEVPSFQWDEDPPAAAPPAPSAPVRSPQRIGRERPAATDDADEDLSEHDWLE